MTESVSLKERVAMIDQGIREARRCDDGILAAMIAAVNIVGATKGFKPENLREEFMEGYRAELEGRELGIRVDTRGCMRFKSLSKKDRLAAQEREGKDLALEYLLAPYFADGDRGIPTEKDDELQDAFEDWCSVHEAIGDLPENWRVGDK